MGDIIIEESNYRSFAMMLGNIFMMAASVAILIFGMQQQSKVLSTIGTLASCGFFMALLILIPRAAKEKKLLTITRDGIIDSSSLGGYGFLSFGDIKEFVIIGTYRSRIIAVIPKDTNKLLTKLPAVKRLQIKKNNELQRIIIPIHVELAKDMEAEDILSLLQKRLLDYSRLYG